MVAPLSCVIQIVDEIREQDGEERSSERLRQRLKVISNTMDLVLNQIESNLDL
jgi:hypothetical protein